MTKARLTAGVTALSMMVLAGCGGVEISQAQVSNPELGSHQFMARTSHFSNDPTKAGQRMTEAAERHCESLGSRLSRSEDPYGTMGEWLMRFSCVQE